MKIHLSVNSKSYILEVDPNTRLIDLLRSKGIASVKDGGCQHGECGACAVLLDGALVNSCQILAAQVVGATVQTVEGLGDHPDHGWNKSGVMSLLQQAFVDSGAIQCGYCTPAMILAATDLLLRNPDPSESEIKACLDAVLCRCTGYLKPVQAVQQAAQWMKEGKDPYIHPEFYTLEAEEKADWRDAGRPVQKVDGVKLALGRPAFTNDDLPPNVLHALVLRSPHAHARIRNIDTSRAKALDGVAAVLTWQDIPRVVYSTAGQSDPIPGPLDSFSLDNKVRHVGDRVAFVAAETLAIAQEALRLIEVDYEILPAVLDPATAMLPDTVRIHDENEYTNFAESDAARNLAAEIDIPIGDVEQGFREADLIIEGDYEVPKVQQVSIEPHTAVTWWDEDDRLVIRTSTQVPFHTRRILAPVLGLPVKQIRVIKPRIGGGFGGKQEILMEDVPAHLTIATGRPVLYTYTREEEFSAARSRHPMRIHMKTGVLKDGTITANQMRVLSDTGAYGCHALTVTGNTGHKGMAIYVGDGKYRESPNIHFHADIVYTNTPPAGAFRGYGVPQGIWAVDRHMEKIAHRLGIDPIAFRLKNALRSGELHPFSTAWSEGREPKPEIVHTVELAACADSGRQLIGWDKKYGDPSFRMVDGHPELRRGIGMAFAMHGTAIPYLDMGGAYLKLNDDGSFNLLVGATDLGTGSDTVLAQMAAEILGVPTADVIVYSSDTDYTPFDKGAYASSTTFISGAAVTKAAKQAAERIKARAAAMLSDKCGKKVEPDTISLRDAHAFEPDGESVTMAEIALNSLHHTDQEQIMGIGSFVSKVSPPPFAAQFAQVLVDIETGQLKVEELVMVVGAGVIMNPITASGQIEGGMVQALGHTICEEMTYDAEGRPNETDLVNYHILRASEIPEMQVRFIEKFEPSHPFGVKALAEIPLDGVAPAVGNAIFHACGADVDIIPATPPRVWQAIQDKKSDL